MGAHTFDKALELLAPSRSRCQWHRHRHPYCIHARYLRVIGFYISLE